MARPRGVPNRNYPPRRLEEALQVPRVIQDQAGGMTVSRLTLAELLGTTPGSSVFKELVASSRFYGLTTGGINAEEFALDQIGERATSEDGPTRVAAFKEAVMSVPPFVTFFRAFNNRKVPGPGPMREFLIRDANVPEAHTGHSIAHILADAETAGLTREISGVAYVDLEGVPRARPDEELSDEDGGDAGLEAPSPEELPAAAPSGDEAPPVPPVLPEEPTRPRAIFVAGRKGKSLDQLVKILLEYKIPHKLAEDEPNLGRPISTKVAETMRECGAAIVVFTPDEELRDLDGNPVWRPSQNIVHELGAAGMQYGNRIVIFREERVSLSANYSDIGHITFKDGDLDAKAIELFRELIAFGLVNITVG